jgi:hypothetical protein
MRTFIGAIQGVCQGWNVAAKSRGIVQWRATVDEDGHYSFAVPPMMPQPATRSNR